MRCLDFVSENLNEFVLEVSATIGHPLCDDAEGGEPTDENVGYNFSCCFSRRNKPNIAAVVVLLIE